MYLHSSRVLSWQGCIHSSDHIACAAPIGDGGLSFRNDGNTAHIHPDIVMCAQSGIKGIDSMDQDPEDAPDSEWTELTFFIETQLADTHPGVIRLRELRKSTKRFLKHSHIFLNQQERGKETVGTTIARLIYDDQIENRQGKYKGPRWDFQRPTRLHLIQVIERPASSSMPGTKPLKKEVGTVHIPGGLDASALIVSLAQVIDEGWQPPPEAAYLAPEKTQTAQSIEPHFPLTVHCLYNYRPLSGPAVFIATEEDGVSIDQCAILLGPHDLDPAMQWYHLFHFEDTWEALFLCDLGIHALSDPILLPAGAEVLPHYWVHEHTRIPVAGGKQVALSRIPNALNNITACFAEAIPSFSIFCSACRQEHRPALDAPVLQEAAHRGYVTTLCPHIFWCPTCACWSTPTEQRLPRTVTGDICTHPRPAGWESRLTASLPAQDTPVLSAALPPGSAHGRPASHPFYEGPVHLKYELDGMLYPPRHQGQYLSVATAEPEPDTHHQVLLVTFLEDCRYKTARGEIDVIPQGTRLIGIWDTDQPEDKAIAAVVINHITWHLTRTQVRLSPLQEHLVQVYIAGEDEDQASECEKQEDYAGAQTCWARAIIEYEASGWTEIRLAPLRMKRAGLLLQLRQDAEAASELERAARTYESQAYHRLTRAMGMHLDYAEQAVDALIPLAMVYLHRTHDQIRARGVLERLLSLNALIKKRYERKVDLLLFLSEFFLDLGDQHEALTSFDQANRFYAQQLAAIADFPSIIPIAKHLQTVKERLQAIKQARTIRFSVTAQTPDDLQAILALLRTGRLPAVDVTKGVSSRRTSKDTRAGTTYVANLRITLDPEGPALG
jgi:tetratricopeptide (TPR) repeat protein